MKKLTVASKVRNDPVQTSKRLVYLIATPMGVLSLILLWGISYYCGKLSWLDYYALPINAFLLLFLFFFLWIRLLPIRSFEYFVYSLTFIYFTIKIYTVLHGAIFDGSQIESDFILWIPFIYILGFSMLDIRNALQCALAFFIIILLLGVFVLFQTGSFNIVPHNFSLLIEIYLSSVFYIIILYLMSRVSEHYVTAQVTADLMSKLAMTDSLTHVDNRRQLEKYLDEEVKRADRHRLPLAIIMFDVDNFKRINDRFGHSTGDMVLVESARIVSDSLRSSDHFGRWGGDEFLCVATNTDEDTANRLADRLRKEINEAQIHESFPVTCSFGVTRFVRGDTPDSLVRRADMGLFRAKNNGRNQVVTIPPETTLPV
jgi:diguanylate cyclase (GGDEF)-like protein